MANIEQLQLLSEGVDQWNEWRRNNPDIHPDLTGAEFPRSITLWDGDFRNAHLAKAHLNKLILLGGNFAYADLTDADLSGSNLGHGNFYKADLRRANLEGADLQWANLVGANLSGSQLQNANLFGADLSAANLELPHQMKLSVDDAEIILGASLTETNLTRADLTGANLGYTRMIGTNLAQATLVDCQVYGIAAWRVNTKDAIQRNLVITEPHEPAITVDDLEVAQFIYLMLRKDKIRDVINTVTSKLVLILGRFTPERKVILDRLRHELRQQDYLAVIFDFDQPATRNLTETVSLLAHLAQFVIADITDAKSIPQELQRIVPNLPSLPVQPLILETQYEYSMFRDFLDYHWVLPPYRYRDIDELVTALPGKVIAPILAKTREIEARRKAIEIELKRDNRTP